MIAHQHVDDVAVVYLNGVEAFRRGFDAGVPVRFSTCAAPRTGRVTIELPLRLLRTGANLAAVEVHQEHERSPDPWFALQLSMADAWMAAASDQAEAEVRAAPVGTSPIPHAHPYSPPARPSMVGR